MVRKVAAEVERLREERVGRIKRYFMIKRIQKGFKKYAGRKGERAMRVNNAVR